MEDELRRGVDLTPYTSKLARFFAYWADKAAKSGDLERALFDLEMARDVEHNWRLR